MKIISSDRQHNDRIDFLRIISAFAVVWSHVSAMVIIKTVNIHSLTWWTGNVAYSYFRWCVPIFITISGSLLLSSPSTLTPIQFYRRRLARILPAIIFWTLIFIAFRKYTEPGFSLMVAIESIVNGDPYFHLWYLYMVIGLYLVTPFLKILVNTLNADSLRLLIFGCFAIAAIESIRGGSNSTFLTRFLPYLGYFLSGYYFCCYRSKLNIWLQTFIILTCGAIISIEHYALIPLLGSRSGEIVFSFNNPATIVMSICIFRLWIFADDLTSFPERQNNPIGQRLSAISLGIYAIHPLCLKVLEKYGVDGFFIHPLIGIPLTTLLAFSLSLLLVAVMSSIPYLRRTVC
jgi:surface polysaccharide O-acyltransferase-like enzyme